MGFNDGSADRQAHPQTARLRRVEGVENVLENLRHQSGPESSPLRARRPGQPSGS